MIVITRILKDAHLNDIPYYIKQDMYLFAKKIIIKYKDIQLFCLLRVSGLFLQYIYLLTYL